MSVKDIAPYKGKRRKLLEALANAENAEDGVDLICRKAGISRTIYYKYIDEPAFRDALKSVVERTYARFAPQVANSVAKLAKKGNLKAADLLHRVLGYVCTSGNVVNVGMPHEDKPIEFANDAERIAYADQVERELKVFRDSINSLQPHKRVSVQGDAIHAEADKDVHEEA